MMNARRNFIRSAALWVGGFSTAAGMMHARADNRPSDLTMPDESHPHSRTWMAFVARPSIWSRRQVPEVKRNLALIAKTIARYEPVSVLVSSRDHDDARRMINTGPEHYPVEFVECEVDDLWLRDTGPTFVIDDRNQLSAIDFNFNGWGNKQQHELDSRVADFITARSEAERITTELVLEGGCFEVDGQGTAILTESCVLNQNRNPHLSRTEVETELMYLLGLRKIIWLEGIRGMDITDGHTDFYARFARPGQVMVSRDNYRASYDYDVTRRNIEILKRSIDADGRRLELTIIDTPEVINETFGSRDFAAGYIGYYVCNGAVIAQKFGDAEADRNARQLLQRVFPGREIEQIAIDGIASGGGSIHCATQQQPAVSG